MPEFNPPKVYYAAYPPSFNNGEWNGTATCRGNWKQTTLDFIEGLELAVERNENVEFR
jgi:hypothetical protein